MTPRTSRGFFLSCLRAENHCMLMITRIACGQSPSRCPVSKFFHQREVDIGIDILRLVVNLVGHIKVIGDF